MLVLPPANGRRNAYLGPIEDAAFVATMWALWWHGHLATRSWRYPSFSCRPRWDLSS
jgi:hypothetical protein